jgi:hypothetical protein
LWGLAEWENSNLKIIKNKKLKLESITDKKNSISIRGLKIQDNNINAFKNTDVN